MLVFCPAAAVIFLAPVSAFDQVSQSLGLNTWDPVDGLTVLMPSLQ